jgi:hypothetical protein
MKTETRSRTESTKAHKVIEDMPVAMLDLIRRRWRASSAVATGARHSLTGFSEPTPNTVPT